MWCFNPAAISLREAQTFDINVVEAKQRLGYEPLDWLGIPPEGHRMDVVADHGVKLGRQVQFIKNAPQFRNCKWVHCPRRLWQI